MTFFLTLLLIVAVMVHGVFMLADISLARRRMRDNVAYLRGLTAMLEALPRAAAMAETDGLDRRVHLGGRIEVIEPRVLH